MSDISDLGLIKPLALPERPQHVLLVDDEIHFRNVYRELMQREGLVIDDCGTGAEALLRLKNDSVDVVVLDLNLPDMHGIEIMEWLALNHVSTSVVIFSADQCMDSAIFALRRGAFEFIRKSCEPEELIQSVENALTQRRLQQAHALMTGKVEQSERLHRFLVENSPDIIYTLDDQGRFIFINGRVEGLLGYARDVLIGQHYSAIVWDEDLDQARYVFNERRCDERAASNVEIRLKCKVGGFRDFDNRVVVAMLSSLGIWAGKDDTPMARFIGTYGVARDITERKKAEETISFQAFHDLLTHLPNRALFKDRLNLAIQQGKRNDTLVGVMFCDLDRFKLINDTYGHAVGDELLRGVAQRVRNCLRAGDTLARQGGDEFTIILPELNQPGDADLIAAKIMAVLDEPFNIDGRSFRATASIGVAIFPEDGDTPDLLIRNADVAMYQVKMRGKNGNLRYRPEMSISHNRYVTFENDLRLALDRNQFELHYQPQVSYAENRVTGFEALIRWRHPDHGLLNPGSFISIAEESGLIVRISDWVLAEGCRQLAAWKQAGFDKLKLSVNLSPNEFERDDLVPRVMHALAPYDVPPSSLEVEITETLLMQDAEKVIDQVRQLRSNGVRVAIDDFGTRYSSLNYLRRFSITSIKIDQSFVRDLDGNHGSLSIIHAILGIAKGFNLHVVAEGVEHQAQVDLLRDLGCHEMQGFLFSEALSGADSVAFLRQRDGRVRVAPLVPPAAG